MLRLMSLSLSFESIIRTECKMQMLTLICQASSDNNSDAYRWGDLLVINVINVNNDVINTVILSFHDKEGQSEKYISKVRQVNIQRH